MEQLLKGKTALITGATSGIGKEIALLFAREGAAVIVTGRRQDRLESIAEQIAREGGVCHYLAGNGGSMEFARQLYDFACSKGGVDILVCSAGMALRTPTLDVSVEEWNQVMDLNLTFPMVLSQCCIKGFLERGGGKIGISFLWRFQSRHGVSDQTSGYGIWRKRCVCQCHLPRSCRYGNYPDMDTGTSGQGAGGTASGTDGHAGGYCQLRTVSSIVHERLYQR